MVNVETLASPFFSAFQPSSDVDKQSSTNAKCQIFMCYTSANNSQCRCTSANKPQVVDMPTEENDERTQQAPPCRKTFFSPLVALQIVNDIVTCVTALLNWFAYSTNDVTW